jgi:hypothetical protein
MNGETMATNLAPATNPEVAQAAVEQAKAKKKKPQLLTPTHRVHAKAREAVDRLFELVPQTHDAKIGKIDLYVTPAQRNEEGHEITNLEVTARAKITMTLTAGSNEKPRTRY